MSGASCTTTDSNAPNLTVESGETVRVAPDSQRFSAAFKRVYPTDIDEVRKIVGLSDASSQALKAQKCCDRATAPASLASPDDLTSSDQVASRRAKEIATQAAYQYVTGNNPAALAQWKPLIDRYLEIGKAVISYCVLKDIEIADGGTLVIAASTRVLYANNIKIHDSGRIVCEGDTTIKCTTLQGIRKLVAHPTAVSSLASSASAIGRAI